MTGKKKKIPRKEYGHTYRFRRAPQAAGEALAAAQSVAEAARAAPAGAARLRLYMEG
jgi:hypothetical protein